jgi:AcrR family transcriptional regulator
MSQKLVKLAPTPVPAEPDKKENIIYHARNLFEQKSFDAVNIREIMQAASVSQPTIYYYFQNKDGLFLTVLLDILDEIDREINRATRELNVYDQLQHIAQAFMEAPAPNLPMLFQELRQRVQLNQQFPEQGITPEQARPAFLFVNQIWPRGLENILREARRTGDAALDNPTFTAHYLLTVFTAYPHSPFNSHIGRNKDLSVAALMDNLKNTLKMINVGAQI